MLSETIRYPMSISQDILNVFINSNVQCGNFDDQWVFWNKRRGKKTTKMGKPAKGRALLQNRWLFFTQCQLNTQRQTRAKQREIQAKLSSNQADTCGIRMFMVLCIFVLCVCVCMYGRVYNAIRVILFNLYFLTCKLSTCQYQKLKLKLKYSETFPVYV